MLLLDDNSLQSCVGVIFKLYEISLVTLCLLFVNRTRATVREKVTSFQFLNSLVYRMIDGSKYVPCFITCRELYAAAR